MKQRLARLLSIGLVISMLQIPVIAETNTINSNTSQNVDVTADVSSSWTVKIPKAITLTSESTGTGTYIGSITVEVEGDIGIKEVITVDTNDTILLTDTTGANTNPVNATTTKGKLEFTFDDLTGGQVSNTTHNTAAELTPGAWEGTLPFYINLERINEETPIESGGGLYDANDVMVASWDEAGIDAEMNYTSSYESTETSGYYVLNKPEYADVVKVVIPESVTSIGNYAFCNCTGLTKIEIPNSVTSIGDWAFSNCTGLTEIEIPNSITTIGKGAFSNCTGLANIEIPEGVTSLGQSAFNYCTNLISIEIPDSVTSSIGNSAFSNCTNLTSATIGNGVTSISSYAFYKCNSLTSVTIGNGVTSMGDGAFNYCPNLASITWNNKTYTNRSEFNQAVRDAGVTTGYVWR